eukprot:scaffold16499_cov18-Tisochrysis_lutea.AAC.1
MVERKNGASSLGYIWEWKNKEHSMMFVIGPPGRALTTKYVLLPMCSINFQSESEQHSTAHVCPRQDAFTLTSRNSKGHNMHAQWL